MSDRGVPGESGTPRIGLSPCLYSLFATVMDMMTDEIKLHVTSSRLSSA